MPKSYSKDVPDNGWNLGEGRTARNGAAPLPEGAREQFEEITTQIRVFLGYQFPGLDHDEIVGETWRKIVANGTRPRNMKAYAIRVAANAAKDNLRLVWTKRAHLVGDFEEAGMDNGGQSDPSVDLIATEQREQFLLLVQRLTPEKRQALAARFLGERLSFDQIAEVLEIPVGTLKTRYRAACQELFAMVHPPKTYVFDESPFIEQKSNTKNTSSKSQSKRAKDLNKSNKSSPGRSR